MLKQVKRMDWSLRNLSSKSLINVQKENVFRFFERIRHGTVKKLKGPAAFLPKWWRLYRLL